MKTGASHYLPAKARHSSLTKEAMVIRVQGNRPFDITYVNDIDDPQKAIKQ